MTALVIALGTLMLVLTGAVGILSAVYTEKLWHAVVLTVTAWLLLCVGVIFGTLAR